MTKQELLNELDAGLTDLKEAYSGLTEEQASEAGIDAWCVKDVLAHVSGWHYETSRMLDRMLRGQRPSPEGVDYSNVNDWNARFVEERKGRSLIEMIADLDTSYREFRSRAESLPEDRLQEGKTAYRMIKQDTIDHYREHGAQIREWRSAAGY